jgi:L-cystine uptake protein TcyP (sodium:dicarboxylate symporter family)
MFKKFTAIISTDHKGWARKARFIVGVTLGIGIGLLLNKVDDSDTVVIEEKEYDEDPSALVEDDEGKEAPSDEG